MGDNSKIEWTDATWSPIRAINLATGKVGWFCEHASPGCANCYAEGINKRLGTGLPFKPGHRKDIEIILDEKMLLAPLRWKKPRMIFVCSMTDLFAEFVTDEWIDRIFAVMALCPQHTFQVLTKRARRMREYMSGLGTACEGASRQTDITAQMFAIDGEISEGRSMRRFSDADCLRLNDNWPLPNCWLGVSAEDQIRADERIPDLLATSAAVRFVSYEPALGPVDFRRWLVGNEDNGVDMNRPIGSRVGACVGWTPPLDWVIAGAESGRGARQCDLAWIRSVRDQCQTAGVAFFWKQHAQNGRKVPTPKLDGRRWVEMPGATP